MQNIQPLPRDEETLAALLEVWEGAVRATHHFLREEDIGALRPQVKGYLNEIEHLYGLVDYETTLGFVGVEGGKLEMLFVNPAARGQGAGKALALFAVERLGARTLDVNEQNPSALGFYRHIGFVQTGRSERDGQGNPFPLLHMAWQP